MKIGGNKIKEKVMINLNYFLVAFLLISFQPNIALSGGSDQGGLAQGIGVIRASANFAVGSYLTKANCPNTNVLLCAQGVSALADGAETLDGLVRSGGKTKAAYSADGADDFDFDTDLPAPIREAIEPSGVTDVETLRRELANRLKEQERGGYKVNKDGTITTPKGKISIGALASGKSMHEAGLISADEIAAYDKKNKDLSDKFKVVSVGVSGGGGGGSGGSYKSASYSYDDPYKNLYGNMGGEKPNAPRTSGLTRTLASGESIGSQSDNIFEMIRRRYQQKSEEKIFVGQEPSGQ
jgi:hypothetical protein